MPAPLARPDLDHRLRTVQRRFTGTLGVAATHLETGEEVLIDAERPFPTASVFKIPVMVEVFRLAHAGRFALDDRLTLGAGRVVPGSGVLRDLRPGAALTIEDLVTLMIIVSDNTATNILIDRVGGIEAINRTMREDYGLASVVLRRNIDFDAIGDDPRRLAEASPRDLMRLCALLATGEVVGPDASCRMLEILGRQHYLNQAPRYLDYNPYGPELGVPQRLWIGCKTGALPGMRADAGVVGLPDGATIAYCLMTEGSADTGFTNENEAEIVNGVVGRLLLEYWWPGDWEADGIGLASPYLAAFLETGAG